MHKLDIVVRMGAWDAAGMDATCDGLRYNMTAMPQQERRPIHKEGFDYRLLSTASFLFASTPLNQPLCLPVTAPCELCCQSITKPSLLHHDPWPSTKPISCRITLTTLPKSLHSGTFKTNHHRAETRNHHFASCRFRTRSSPAFRLYPRGPVKRYRWLRFAVPETAFHARVAAGFFC